MWRFLFFQTILSFNGSQLNLKQFWSSIDLIQIICIKKITKHFDLLKKAISFDKTETFPNKTIQISADDGIYIWRVHSSTEGGAA